MRCRDAALLVGAATCVAAGLLMMLGVRFLSELLGPPTALLQYAGVSLVGFTAFLLYVVSRPAAVIDREA